MSILPHKYCVGLNLNPTPAHLSSATGESITCYGETVVDISIPQLRRVYKWTMIVADTTHALLGLDFLSHHNLIIDCGKQQVIDRTTKFFVDVNKIEYDVFPVNVIFPVGQSPEIQHLLESLPALTLPQQIPGNSNKAKVFHRIDTGDRAPVHAKARQLSEEKLAIAKQEFNNLLDMGIVRRSESPWASPLHLVPKPTPGQWRPCGDYRALNAITKPDRYCMPHIHSVTSKLHGIKYFSKIDLFKAFHQIPMNPNDIEKTAVATPFGTFEYLYMPFGLKNASATLQRHMDNLFMNVACAFIYLDDILIFSKSREQHLRDVATVLKVLNDNGPRISVNKCSFLQESIDFLGCNISAEGVKPTQRKLYEINDFGEPTDSKSLRRFLGMVGFYRRIVPNFANVVLPLTELIKMQPNAKELTLNTEEKQAFSEMKKILSELSALPYPTSAITHYQIVTDSSSYAVGAALHQVIDSQPVPIGFFSKKLSESQRHQSTFDRELLAAYLAVLHFKPQIEGRHVTLFTDHKPLMGAYKKPNLLKSDKQQRHLSLISEYVADVSYIRGNQNTVADCLSRPTNAVTVDLYDLPALARERLADEEIKAYDESLKTFKINDKTSILCDISTPFPRPFVPKACRQSLFINIHGLSHPGVRPTLRLIKARYYWPNMDKEIRTWTRDCQACQQSKIHRHTKSEVQPFHLPSDRFETVHVDIVGPLPVCKDTTGSFIAPYRYLLTCIDRATRWIEACPLEDITAASVAVAFMTTWISRFGVPLYVVTDRGTQFESELFQELSTLAGFHRLRTTPFHPQANGMIERQHRTLKTAITARKENWLQALPIVLLGIRITPKESGFSPFSAVTGSSLLFPRPLIVNPGEVTGETFNSSQVRALATEMAKLDFAEFAHGKHHCSPKAYYPPELLNCTHVWVRVDRIRRPLEAPYSGPFPVVRREDKYFVIDNMGKEQSISVDRLKPVHQSLSAKPTTVSEQSSDVSADTSLAPDDVEDAGSGSNADNSLHTPISNTNDSISRSGRHITFKQNPNYFYY